MKKIFIAITIAAAALLTACHEPQFIPSNADRQGLTSLSAIFTFGPYVDQELARLMIDDDNVEKFVIPIPYYYPTTSDNITEPYMVRLRVQAELQPNFKISPKLGILDLTEENHFTYTDPNGKSREIIITGQRVKSSECDVLSFTLSNPTVSGVIDKAARTIVLPTKDDVSKATATVAVSAHASVYPDLSKPRDYTNPVKIIVTAHDGTEAEYTVMTGNPEKIDQGFDPNSLEKLFNFDPVSRLSMPDYSSGVPISLAAIGGKLVICTGDGSVPVYINGLTGVKEGVIKLGSAVPGSVTNDEMEHLLITNVAQGGDNREIVNLYKTSSVSAEPVLFYSFENPIDVPIGHKVKVMGDIENDAVVVYTAEGIAGVTSTAKVIALTVSGGSVTSMDVVDFAGITGGWGGAPTHIATVVPASLTPAKDGWYFDYYDAANCEGEGDASVYFLNYSNGAATQRTVVSKYPGWAYDPNCLDSKSFNHCRYMTLFITSHFPNWGAGPKLYLYNITDPTAPTVEMANEEMTWYQIGAYNVASGDVVLSTSGDGFKMYVYYYDNNAQVVGGYVVDCIRR